MIPLIFDYINFTTLGTKMATGPVVRNYVQRFGKNSTKETDKTSNEIQSNLVIRNFLVTLKLFLITNIII